MALVAYDSSSDSEGEERYDKDITDSCVIVNTVEEKSRIVENSVNSNDLTSQNNIISPENNLFLNLPKKKNVKETMEDQIEDFVPKSKPSVRLKEKVKISIPALSTFGHEDDDKPEIKKFKLSIKGSGLMSLLPPVKGTIATPKSFVPNVIANKMKNNSKDTKTDQKLTKPLVPSSVRKKANDIKKSAVKPKQDKKEKHESDVESDVDDIEMPETFDDEMWEKVCGRPKLKQIIQETKESEQQVIDIAPEPEKPYEGLDNKAFKELVGKSKRPIGNIKLIDINEEEILSDKDLWMTKSLTDPEMAPKPQVEDPVDPTRRKKHHITYLAQQAKANEQELQNAWSASKNNRLATRAKYGF